MSELDIPLYISDVRGEAQRILENLRQRLARPECTSVTLTIRDPLSPYFFRLAAECGVKSREVMHGPLSVASFLGSTMMDPIQREMTDWFGVDKINELRTYLRSLRENVATESHLNASFVERENVHCTQLLRFVIEEEIQACVFVNFSDDCRKLSKKNQKTIDAFASKFRKILPRLLWHFASQVPSRLRRIEPIRDAALCYPQTASGATIEEYLAGFLQKVFLTYGLEHDGFAGIYTFDAPGILRKCVQRGTVAANAKTSFSVSKNEGLISVAASRGTPLIVDSPAEKFRHHYVTIDAPNVSPTTRQLAIPLLVGTEVVGVLNLESKSSSPGFDENDVFDLTTFSFPVASAIHVAKQAATAHELRTLRLLEIASRAISGDSPSEVREDLQDWAKVVFRADSVSIWQWSATERHFTPEDRPESPRQRGFSQLIQETRKCVLWTDATDPSALEVVFWNEGETAWGQDVPSLNGWFPEDVNGHLKGEGIVQQLGMPVVFREECVGVVWFKFRDVAPLLPTASRMKLAAGVAAEIGVILQLNGIHEEHVVRNAVDLGLKGLYSSLCQTGNVTFEGGSGYAIVHPIGSIGGDFFAKAVSKDVTAFIVGDGEGHGILGATRMLPLYTAFKNSSRRFRSPSHTLWEMGEFLEGVDDVRGTAICFVVDYSRDNPRLIVSSAAHPKLMVFRPGGEFRLFPHGDQEGFQIGVARGLFYDNLLDESQHDLKSGDILVAVTDGVIEAGSKRTCGSFGVDKVSGIVPTMRGSSAELIAREIEEAMLKHCSHDVFDDYTVLVLRIT